MKRRPVWDSKSLEAATPRKKLLKTQVGERGPRWTSADTVMAPMETMLEASFIVNITPSAGGIPELVVNTTRVN